MGLSARLASSNVWVCHLDMAGEMQCQDLPYWDPFWSRILAFHISAILAGKRCHGTLGMGSFEPYLTVESFVGIHFFIEVIKKKIYLIDLH